ncbi:MAG: 30S ribosome-binding factor RbfA [Chlamydiales bacterium]
MSRRIERVNSLLKEVISETIRDSVKNPHVSQFVTITSVEVTKDLRYAKVYVSVIGENKDGTLSALQSAAGFIAVQASKKVELRYFPELRFALDTSLDKQLYIETMIQNIQKERENRDGV